MPRSRRIDPDLDPDLDPQDEIDTDEEEAPAPRRRRTAAAKDDTPPPVRKRRPTDEDDDEDDDDEDEEPAAPVTRRRRTAAPAAEKKAAPKRRASRDEDEETGDEDSDEDFVIPISRGHKEIKKNRPVSEGNLAFFRWDEEPQLIKFLDNEPWSYDQHWVTREGKQSFPCIGKGCPLCAIGVKISQKIVYPILNLTPTKGDDFLTQSLEVGPQLDDVLISHDASTKTGPLTRLWWSVSRSESATSGSRRKKYSYTFTPVKDRDLDEDWEIDLDEAEDAVAAAKIPEPKDVLGEWNRKQLQEIADEAMGH
jgi:hypothetical protein